MPIKWFDRSPTSRTVKDSKKKLVVFCHNQGDVQKKLFENNLVFFLLQGAEAKIGKNFRARVGDQILIFWINISMRLKALFVRKQ